LSREIERYAQLHPQLGSSASLPPLLGELIESWSPGKVILDLGCGEGRTLRGLSASVDRQLLAGVDLSFVRASAVRALGFLAVVADGLRLPIGSASVDLVVCRNVIEHVQDDLLLAREIARVLRDGGMLYLETAIRLRGAWYPYRNDHGKRVLDPTHVREYESVRQVRDLLASAALLPVRESLASITFPLPHLVHRVLRAVDLRRRTPQRVADWPVLRVPRYREIQLVARRDRRE
jgi:SAM-dependent methyltransferase